MKHRYKPSSRHQDLLTPASFAATLQALFPDVKDFPDAELVANLAADEANYHRVLSDFKYAFDWEENSAELFQLRELAKLIEFSLGTNDQLENAWLTVFWEARGLGGPLWAALSPNARKYIREVL